jgi:peroxiredoxin (alkyl hydroperoxide reductase subunit C)
VIQYYTVNNLLCGRSINEILRVLESIQYLKEHPGQACPVDWKYGDKTIYSHPLKSKLYFKELYAAQKN